VGKGSEDPHRQLPGQCRRSGRRRAIASSGFGVQLGAFSSAERANEEWLKLQKDAAGMLDGLSPRVVVGDAGGKTIYRLQAEVRDEAQARAICGGLKVAKKPCVPVIPR
jgi:D-alanyl-D-alanine carboxypeptidase